MRLALANVFWNAIGAGFFLHAAVTWAAGGEWRVAAVGTALAAMFFGAAAFFYTRAAGEGRDA